MVTAPVTKALSERPVRTPATTATGTSKRVGRRLGKAARQRALLALLDTTAVSSQSELRVELQAEGLGATQATISRDLEELGVVKVRGVDGRLVYARPRPTGKSAPGAPGHEFAFAEPSQDQGQGSASVVSRSPAHEAGSGRAGSEPEPTGRQGLQSALAISLVRLGATGNLVVAHTRPGHAPLLASALDHAEHGDIVGTVAGDDTVFIACAEGVRATVLAEQLAVLASARGHAWGGADSAPTRDRAAAIDSP